MARPHGQIRQSQMITTFGPGALVDLPRNAAIVAGLDSWNWGGDDRRRQIPEPRLVAKIEEILNLQGLKLYEPPADDPEPGAPPSGVTAYEFPEWFAAQMPIAGPQGQQSRPLVHRMKLRRQKQISRARPKNVFGGSHSLCPSLHQRPH